ncbi:hypothetical protein [Chlorobium sp. KB01]|nr:hypothetical protein [Chlorobium sp. KB01]
MTRKDKQNCSNNQPDERAVRLKTARPVSVRGRKQGEKGIEQSSE